MLDEISYQDGSRMAWLTMLRVCIRQLGVTDIESAKTVWLLEREEALRTLRSVCDRFGDNDWTETNNLSDIIERHLWDYLESNDNGKKE